MTGSALFLFFSTGSRIFRVHPFEEFCLRGGRRDLRASVERHAVHDVRTDPLPFRHRGRAPHPLAMEGRNHLIPHRRQGRNALQ